MYRDCHYVEHARTCLVSSDTWLWKWEMVNPLCVLQPPPPTISRVVLLSMRSPTCQGCIKTNDELFFKTKICTNHCQPHPGLFLQVDFLISCSCLLHHTHVIHLLFCCYYLLFIIVEQWVHTKLMRILRKYTRTA